MRIEDLKTQIELYKQDSELPENAKNLRINIIVTAIQRIESYELYSKSLFQFLEESGQLVDLTEQLYQIEDTLELNRISLKGLILESILCHMLNQNGIEYSSNDLKQYLYQNINNPDIDAEVISKEIMLYETIEELINYENSQINSIASIIGNTIGVKIVDRNSNDETINNNKKELEEKAKELLDTNILDKYTYDLLISMIYQIINNFLKIEYITNNSK